MLRTMRLAACLSVVSFWVNAQSVDARLTFEVASVKPSEAPEGPIPGFGRAIGGPGSNSPGQFTSTGMSLRRLLFQIAYNFKDYQYAAPAWMDKERYDVVAKVPPGITRDQFRVMLQNLLIDRFKITSHHEQREVTMYDLVVVKGGPKMKPSTVDPKAALAAPGPGGSLHLERDAGGFPAIPAGSGPMTLGTAANRQSVLVTNKYSMEQLVDQLSRNLNQPVIDKTELKATGPFCFTTPQPDRRPTVTGQRPVPTHRGSPRWTSMSRPRCSRPFRASLVSSWNSAKALSMSWSSTTRRRRPSRTERRVVNPTDRSGVARIAALPLCPAS